MDYLVVGSNGFAQLGDPDYFAKAKIETRILMEYLRENFPVPEEFANVAHYSIMPFHHDFGTYYEIVIKYDDSFLSRLEESEIESEVESFLNFWTWAGTAEVADLETEELLQKMRSKYLEENPVSETPQALASKGPLHVAFRKAS